MKEEEGDGEKVQREKGQEEAERTTRRSRVKIRVKISSRKMRGRGCSR